MALGIIITLKILSIPIHELRISLHLLGFLYILSATFCSFLSTSLSPFLLSVFLSDLLILVLLEMEFF